MSTHTPYLSGVRPSPTLLLKAVLKHERTYKYLAAHEWQPSLKLKWEAKLTQCESLKWRLSRRRLKQIGFFD